MRRNKFIRAVKNPMVWLKLLVSAAVSAAAGGVISVLAKPESFNFETGLPNLISVAGACAIVGIANYLKDCPVPE